MQKRESVKDLAQVADQLSGTYENTILSVVNNHVVRISRMTEPYFWHFHPNSDEMFIGVEGTLIVEMEDEQVKLSPGQTFTVPHGVKHRTAPAGAHSVNLTIERADMITVRVAV